MAIKEYANSDYAAIHLRDIMKFSSILVQKLKLKLICYNLK